MRTVLVIMVLVALAAARDGRPAPPPMPPDHANDLIRHIGAICEACRERLAHPSVPENEAAIIEDCPFVAMSACRRRREIREGKAKCPLGLWSV